MFEKLFSYHEIGELQRDQNYVSAIRNDKDKRKRIPIAIIDDEPFTAQQTLTNHGYTVFPLGDLKNLNEINDYNIILCDLRGVGRHFDGKHQGAYLIDEIKRNHPEKFVVAYTGGALDDDMAIKANRAADIFIKKDADIEEWRDKLDDLIDRLSNPIIVWRRQRDALVKNNVSTLDIIRLEDAFVKSIKDKDPDVFRRRIEKFDVASDARSIAQSLVASGIFALLTG